MLLKELSSLASPLSQSQVDKMKQLTAELNSVQLAWVSGYLAATANASGSAIQVAASVTEAQAAQTVTILYGSQTGNGRGIAKALAEKAKTQGYSVNLASMGEYNVRQLKQETLLLLVVSTHGEGEAPDDAIELHKFLASKRAPQLNNLHYSVLALKDFDARLSALGAKALLPLVECDVDYEAAAGQWHADVLTAVKPLIQTTANAVALNEINSSSAQVASESEFTKQNPYSAEVLVSQKITGRDSDRDVRHVEIDLGESGLRYEVGDALGVWFSNSEILVEEILAGLGLAADAKVTVGSESISLKQALIDKKELTQLYPGLVKAWAELSADPELLAISEDKEQVRQFILHHQFADLVANYKLTTDANLDASKLVELLRPLTPRLYSRPWWKMSIKGKRVLAVLLTS